MKANYKVTDSGKVVKDKGFVTQYQVDRYLSEDWENRVNGVYANAKRDVSAQILAVFFTVMQKEHGWGKKRLMKLKGDVEAYFALMQQGVFNKSFTPVDCIDYIKEEFGIDLDKEEILK